MDEIPASAPRTSSPPRSIALRSLAEIVALFGLFAIIGNCTVLVLRIFGNEPVAWHDVPWRFAFWEAELRLFAALVGVAFVYAAWLISRGKWRHGLVIVLVAFVLAIVNPPLNTMLRHHFAGDSYTIEAP